LLFFLVTFAFVSVAMGDAECGNSQTHFSFGNNVFDCRAAGDRATFDRRL